MTDPIQAEIFAEHRAIRHNYFGELRELQGAEFVPTEDMDMVWAFSGHGTFYTEGDQPPYAGASFDRLNIEAGIGAVYAITGERLGKSAEEVTKEDIEAHGPTFFYNGESAADGQTDGMHYPQNDALALEIATNPDFPLPVSKVAIRPIRNGYTPSQMDGFVGYMAELQANGQPTPRNVVVVSSFGHRPRVGRYLEHHKDRFPEGITFANGPVPNEAEHDVNGTGIVRAEVQRVIKYQEKGDLAIRSALGSAA